MSFSNFLSLKFPDERARAPERLHCRIVVALDNGNIDEEQCCGFIDARNNGFGMISSGFGAGYFHCWA
jgi:hypothetical protein